MFEAGKEGREDVGGSACTAEIGFIKMLPSGAFDALPNTTDAKSMETSVARAYENTAHTMVKSQKGKTL
jgi:hypothetical protein